MTNDRFPESNIEPNSPIERRSLLKGAAWTVPIIATTVALPHAAASESPIDGAATLSVGPLEAPDGVNPTEPEIPVYLSGATYTFQGTFENAGTVPIPAGYVWSVGVYTSRGVDPNISAYNVWDTPVITNITSPYTTTPQITNPGALYFSLNQALPVGGTFTVTYTASLTTPLGNNDNGLPYFSTITYATAEDDANTTNRVATGPEFEVSDTV